MNDSAHHLEAALTPSERIIRLVRQILGPPMAGRPLPIDARLNDLGMSSIKMVNFMLALEAEFDVTIPQGDITPENFTSIASVDALIVSLSSSKSAL